MNSKGILDSLYYTFDPNTKSIMFHHVNIKKEELLLITNLTRNKIIYNFACPTEGGTLTGNTLVLVTDTSTMSSSDKLLVVILTEDKKEKYLSQLVSELKEFKEITKPLLNLNTEDSILGNFIIDKINNKPRVRSYYKHISTATTTVCKVGEGFLKVVVINNPSNDIITVYDNHSATGEVIAIINPGLSTVVPFFVPYELHFTKGLTIVTAGAPDLTIIFE